MVFRKKYSLNSINPLQLIDRTFINIRKPNLAETIQIDIYEKLGAEDKSLPIRKTLE